MQETLNYAKRIWRSWRIIGLSIWEFIKKSVNRNDPSDIYKCCYSRTKAESLARSEGSYSTDNINLVLLQR